MHRMAAVVVVVRIIRYRKRMAAEVGREMAEMSKMGIQQEAMLHPTLVQEVVEVEALTVEKVDLACSFLVFRPLKQLEHPVPMQIGTIVGNANNNLSINATSNLMLNPSGGNIYVSANIIPTTSGTYTLGTAEFPFGSAYFKKDTVYVGSTFLLPDSVGNVVLTSADGTSAIADTTENFMVAVGTDTSSSIQYSRTEQRG